MEKNKKVILIDLFAGISAFRKALMNLDYAVESHCVEIDKNAVKSYNAIYGENAEPKSVEDVDFKHLKGKVDILTAGFPCQDISVAGKQLGMKEGSNTRSSLVWPTIDIIEDCMPKYIIIENVKAILFKNNIDDFLRVVKRIEDAGYKTSYENLNAIDFGIPQNRERVFLVGIRNDLDNDFNFSNLERKEVRPLSDFVDFENLQKLTHEDLIRVHGWKCQQRPLKNVYGLNGITHTINTRHAKCSSGSSILVTNQDIVKENFDSLTKIHPDLKIGYPDVSEIWKLMGFDLDDYKKAAEVCSYNQLSKQAGNSIVVNVVESILKEIFVKESNE